MDARVAEPWRLRRFVAFLLDGLALTGMALAVVGLYGSLANLVDLRRREITIRVALGASQSRIPRIVLSLGAVTIAAASLPAPFSLWWPGWPCAASCMA
jgi:hypothetical protein